ncbi:hypothetical protein BC360_03780 [Ensifer sp. LC163]|nr:hypothetical protein BC361_10600 [Ensifer sp. LC54]OCP20421.1 hypothetical protein BC363_06300 [Ensifer sp. LC384]OCP36514.1 hypothetical protein BC360_03780 [Ensifer sp. LC163]
MRHAFKVVFFVASMLPRGLVAAMAMYFHVLGRYRINHVPSNTASRIKNSLIFFYFQVMLINTGR